MKKFVSAYGSIVFVCLLVIGVTSAAFTDKADILGATFSVGSADIKLLDVLSDVATPTNLVDEKVGPVFDDIGPNWQEDYLVKLYNNSLAPLLITSNASYETANDPEELRQIIYVEPILWVDTDLSGTASEDELGDSLGKKTIVKWKTEGFDFGEIASGDMKGLVLRFSTENVSATKQGSSAIFDFEFESIGL